MDLYKYIYDHSSKIEKIYHYGESPFENVGLQLMFYRPKGLELEKVSESVSQEEFIKNNSDVWFMSKRGNSIGKFEKLGCEIKAMTYPQWVLKFNFFNWVERSRVWTLFYCK